jgi:hypothetical protein
MLEGLTSEILNYPVFEGLYLRIVAKSHIKNDNGKYLERWIV